MEVTRLVGLKVLKLQQNRLTGKIFTNRVPLEPRPIHLSAFYQQLHYVSQGSVVYASSAVVSFSTISRDFICIIALKYCDVGSTKPFHT